MIKQGVNIWNKSNKNQVIPSVILSKESAMIT